MKQESHHLLGRYLMNQLPMQPKKRHIRAFYIGCVEPDRNPFSYLKGSVRSKWLPGHNYQNAQQWIDRTLVQLQRKQLWSAYDYFRPGKLIHSTSDVFTYVHHNCFTVPPPPLLVY